MLRPHGHVMRTGSALTPDERSVTTTTWMRGGFHSQVTQGHVALGSVLSLRRSYLDLFRAYGTRIFVAPADHPDDWRLLGMPSAWSVAPDRCRWWYRSDDGTIEVTSSAPADDHAIGLEVRVVDGPPCRLLVALHVALGDDDGAAPQPPGLRTTDDGVVLTPPAGGARERTYPGATVALVWTATADTQVARDEPLFADGRSRDLPWVTLTTEPVTRWSLTLRPRLVPDEDGADAPAPVVEAPETTPFWSEVGERLRLRLPAGAPAAGDAAGLEVARLDAVLPWFAHDALVHYLSPRGLEQYTGGGWGTRDVSQGPVGLLLALGEHEALRDVVVRLLRAQHARGDWPQAFDFYARHRSWQVSDAHGDVVYWPLLAIGDYLVVTGDDTLLAQAEPMVADGHATEPRSAARPPGAGARPRRGIADPGDDAAGLRARRLERQPPARRPGPGRRPVLDVDGDAAGAGPAHPRRRPRGAAVGRRARCRCRRPGPPDRRRGRGGDARVPAGGRRARRLRAGRRRRRRRAPHPSPGPAHRPRPTRCCR